MQIGISLDTKPFEAALSHIRNGLPTASYKALNATAEVVQQNLVKEMVKTFDRPSAYTLNSMRINYAKREKLVATVTFKDSRAGKFDSPGHYLAPQVFGGPRQQRPGERRLSFNRGNQQYYLVPTRYAPKDSIGNLPRGFMQKVLADLGALTKREDTLVTVKRRRKAKPKGYFAVYDKAPGLAPGIYRRVRSGFGQGVVPIFIFSKSTPKYRAILKWQEVGEQTVSRVFPDRFKEEVDHLIAGAKQG